MRRKTVHKLNPFSRMYLNRFFCICAVLRAPTLASVASAQQRPLSTFYNPYLITEPKEATRALLRQQSVVKLLPDGENAPPYFEGVADVQKAEEKAHQRRVEDLLVRHKAHPPVLP